LRLQPDYRLLTFCINLDLVLFECRKAFGIFDQVLRGSQYNIVLYNIVLSGN